MGIVPTRVVWYRRGGHQARINEDDFDPALHSEHPLDAEPEPEAPAEPVDPEDEEEEEDSDSISDMNSRDSIAYINLVEDAEDLKDLLAEEKANKKRRGVANAIEKRLDEVRGR